MFDVFNFMFEHLVCNHWIISVLNLMFENCVVFFIVFIEVFVLYDHKCMFISFRRYFIPYICLSQKIKLMSLC